MSKRKSARRQSIRQSHDANTRVPETLTTEVINWIRSLPDCDPKVIYLKSQFMAKFVSSDTDPADVRRQRAINKWLSVECDNDATNVRLMQYEEDYNILPRVEFAEFIRVARGYVADLIGETVPLESLFGGFSGGATTSRSRTESHPANKYLGQAEITSAARKWFELVLDHSPMWKDSGELDIVEIRGNHIFTVPKSTEIDRCAAKEPDLNMYMQKGVGNFFRSALRTVGINLNDQSRNQFLARKGSIDNTLATIDLSSASDSLTIECVRSLLPDLWFGLLADLRSPYTLIGEEWHENHMFSSMGNGFTFELESLIFWALAKTTRHFVSRYRCLNSRTISVYGDDIIVGTDFVHELMFVLQCFGFSVNDKKSFTDGPFRESCGGHYYQGMDITPFYLREPLSRLTGVIRLANQIRAWSLIPGLGILNPLLSDLWVRLKEFIPDKIWSGIDTSVDTSLVVANPNKFRLDRCSTEMSTGLGGYFLWLDSCGERVLYDDAFVSSSSRRDKARYRVRRVQADVRRPPSIFLQELGTDTEAEG